MGLLRSHCIHLGGIEGSVGSKMQTGTRLGYTATRARLLIEEAGRLAGRRVGREGF